MRRIINILAILTITAVVYSQEKNTPRISLQVDSLKMPEFIQLLETDYQLNFYYNPDWIDDSSGVNVNYNNVELLSGIEGFFEQFGLGVYGDLPDIYITRGVIPKKGFSRDFYESLTTGAPIPIEVIYAIGNEDVKEVVNGSLIDNVQFGNPSPKKSGKKFYIKGILLDALTGEGIIGATIQIVGTSTGTVTDIDGHYSLVIPSGHSEIIYRAVGKKSARRTVTAYDNGNLDLSLSDDVNLIDQVTIIGQFNDKVSRMDGAEKINMKMLNKSIMILGETDI